MTPELVYLAGLAAGVAIGSCVGVFVAIALPSLVDFVYRVRHDRRA